MTLKLHTQNKNILNAEEKFSRRRIADASSLSISQLGDIAKKLLNNKNLEVSKVRPFFWSLVETYVDRFNVYPFDARKALFSQLELKNFPEDEVQDLVRQLQAQFELNHGRPLHKSTQLVCQQDVLDDEIKALRGSLKYAALVDEKKQGEE